MELIFLHGPPAVGKLPVARCLHERIPSRLVDNHATIDLALTLFDFGAPGFWDLVAELRKDMLAAAAASDLAYLITTGCYIHPEDLPLVEGWEAILKDHGARLRPVHLSAPQETLFERVGQPDRIARGKLASKEGLEGYLARNDYAPLPRPGCLRIDTSATPPQAVADRIVKELQLTTV